MVKFSNKTLDDWNNLASKELKKQVSEGEQKLSWESEEGIELKALYTKEDLEGLEHFGSDLLQTHLRMTNCQSVF